MDTKGYYKSLGVNENASDAEIKKAFRKLSLKYHPDKQGGKTDAERKEAEDKFKEINEAYQILSDPEKKKNYDQYGDPSGRAKMGGFDFGDMGGYNPFEDLFKNQFGGNPFGGFRQAEQAIPGSDIKMQVPLTIEDVFNGCTKKLKFKKKVRCSNCHGKGGSHEDVCRNCNGTGYVSYRQRTAFGMASTTSPCPNCHGKGTFLLDKCPTCNGTGFKEVDTIVEVTFAPGMMEGYAVQKVGEGSESQSVKGLNGDFYAIAKYAFSEDEYIVKGLDVVQKVYLPYYDILLGTNIEINFPNGTKKKIVIPSCLKEGKLLKLYREGIKADENHIGDYYLEVHYMLPSEITDDERKHLEAIKVINYKNDKK